MSDRVSKTRILFTVFSLTEDVERLRGMDLSDIVEETKTGDFLGHMEMGPSHIVPTIGVSGELRAAGNDGTFFDLPTGLDTEERT